MSNLFYKYNKVNKTAEVKYNRTYRKSLPPKVVIPDTIEYNGETFRVTSIGDRAFQDCVQITEVVLNNDIDYIGYDAFAGCEQLERVELPKNLTSISGGCFRGTSLKQITIPEGVERIGESAFDGCKQLRDVILPNSLKEIENEAFYYCIRLNNINIPQNVEFISEYAFRHCVSLPIIEGIRYAGEFLVEVVDKTRTTYSIKEGTRWIGSWAFNECIHLTEIHFPDSMEHIADNAFLHCYNLPVIDNIRYADTFLVRVVDKTLNTYHIKEGTKWMGQAAFYRCKNLKNIDIPDTVVEIGRSVFSDCKVLQKFEAINCRKIGSAFNGCSNLTEVHLPKIERNIDNGTFYGCSSLKEITIPEGITSIDGEAFHSCKNLTRVTFLNIVDYVSEGAFEYCDNLTEISIPKGSKRKFIKAGLDAKLLVEREK